MLCSHYVPVNLTRGAFKVAVNCRLPLRNAALCERGAWQGTPPGSSAAPPPVIKLARWNIGKADGAAAKIFAGCTENAERCTLFPHLFIFYLLVSPPQRVWTVRPPPHPYSLQTEEAWMKRRQAKGWLRLRAREAPGKFMKFIDWLRWLSLTFTCQHGASQRAA